MLLQLLVKLHHCLQSVILIKCHSFMLDCQILRMLQDEVSRRIMQSNPLANNISLVSER